jgi:hypothetical protein
VRQEFLDEIRENRRTVQGVAADLRDLASSLARVGNSEVAQELRTYAAELDGATKALGVAVNKDLNHFLKEVQEGAAETMRFVLALVTKSA